MIIGIGCDIVRIARIAQLLARFKDRFTQRILTDFERTFLLTATYCAKRFAAKEALLKAIGRGLSAGISWQDIEVMKHQNQPRIQLRGIAAQCLAKLVPLGRHARIHVSLSDETEHAIAHVVIEAL